MKVELEHEIKVLGIDALTVERKIKELGGVQILDDLTVMEWFDILSLPVQLLKSEDLLINKYKLIKYALNIVFETQKSLRDQGILLRLRKQGDVFDLTLKQKTSGAECLITTNTEMSELFDESVIHDLKMLLSASGFSVVARHEKKRKSYILPIQQDKVRLDLDTWPLIPQYMEIEGSPSLISKAISIMGLETNETTNLVAADFFAIYGVDFFSDLSFTKKI